MNKNLSWKFALIVGLVALAAWTLYPPGKTLKPGIDLGGGTSLIYEIDAKGLSADEKRGLSDRVITVLRRRIDPANIQNLVWRPQGSTRFEIQMPLASKEARDKRMLYENRHERPPGGKCHPGRNIAFGCKTRGAATEGFRKIRTRFK